MLDLLCERPGSYVLSTSDLSPGALTCAVLIFVFSGAHMYLWNRLQNILWLTVGLVLSTVSFSVWKYWKEQPQSAYWYILALAVPGVHGLCVEIYICWRLGPRLVVIKPPHFLARLRTKQTIWRSLDAERAGWSITIIGVIVITLQLLGFSGVVAVGGHKLPPFVGSLFFHGSATFVLVGILWKHARLRQLKLMIFACGFTIALVSDVASLVIYYVLPGGCFDGPLYLVSCILEASLILLLLLVRLHTRYFPKQPLYKRENWMLCAVDYTGLVLGEGDLRGDSDSAVAKDSDSPLVHQPPSSAAPSIPKNSPAASFHMA